MKRVALGIFSALGVGGLALMLMAPTGGYPYFPIFGGVTVKNSSNSTVESFSQGNVVFNAPASGVTFTANGLANQSTVSILGSSTPGQSYGLQVTAGTTSADNALYVSNNSGTVLLETFGDGGIVVGTATGGDQGAATINVAGGYYVNGTKIIPPPRISYGAVTQTGNTTCALVSGAGSSNVSVSCPSQGDVVITFSTAYTTFPACTATPTSVGTDLINGGTSSATLLTFNAGQSANINTITNFVCVGT